MTKAQEVYATILNVLGSDVVENDPLQDIVDCEHAMADPAFARELAKRTTLQSIATG